MNFNKEAAKKNSTEINILAERGVRLAEVREKLGFKTLDDFGVVLGKKEGKSIDKSTLSKYERGTMAISKKILVELNSTFKVNVDYILYGKPPMFYLENADKITETPTNPRDKKDSSGINNNEETGTNFGNDSNSNQSTSDMIAQLMNLMQQQNQIADKTASALDKFGDAYKSMASTMEILIGERRSEHPLKKTGS